MYMPALGSDSGGTLLYDYVCAANDTIVPTIAIYEVDTVVSPCVRQVCHHNRSTFVRPKVRSRSWVAVYTVYICHVKEYRADV